MSIFYLFIIIYDADNLLSNPPSQKLASFFNEVKAETSYKFTLSELEAATNKFVKQVGSGGYGVVYYGKLKDGKEIAVKVLTSDSFQGNREFSNEVYLIISSYKNDGKNIEPF